MPRPEAANAGWVSQMWQAVDTCMIMNTLVRILTSFLVLSQSISSSYFTSSPCVAQAPPDANTGCEVASVMQQEECETIRMSKTQLPVQLSLCGREPLQHLR